MSAELTASVRTVIHLAEYFAELKQNAAVLADSSNAVGRGFFSAAEDEQVEALLVSYWQSRSALFDLIGECRDFAERQTGERETAFLVGFAAALILVDAARFLRDKTENQPVIRRKLNQPVPTFNIPGGTYDTIQRSLLSARHAWHLYHALRYFDENETRLREFVRARGLTDVLAVIDRLRQRINVRLEQFARSRLRTRGDQILRKVGRTLFQRALYGLQKSVSSMMADVYVRSGHQPCLPDAIVAQLERIVQPGDVFVVRKEYAVTNYFLPGFWPHAALYLGRSSDLEQLGIGNEDTVRSRRSLCRSAAGYEERHVIEAMKDGVLVRSWSSPLRSDSVLILRPRLSPQQCAAGILRALAHESKRYDFDFNFARSDRLVCTEVIYRAYDGIGNLTFPLTIRAGRPTLSGADLVQMACDASGFDAVALYAARCGPRLRHNESLLPLIREIVANA